MIGEILTILLVEDNDDHAELVNRTFEEHRVANKLIRLSDGEQALSYLFRKDPSLNTVENPLPNLILLDLRLPKVDGMEVLRQVKSSQKLKEIPVVILTSSESEKDIARAYDSYVNSYLVKPLDFEQFTKMMDALGYYWLAWNRLPF